MSQTSYSQEQPVAFAGMKSDARFDEVETFAAAEAIPFGRAVAGEAGELKKVYLPKNDNGKIVFDADFVASNSIAVSVNSVAITPVVFATDHATTAAAVAAAVDALAGVTCVLDPLDATKRTYLIETEGATTAITAVVTLGASQAVATITYSADDVFRGIALAVHKEQEADGTTRYNTTDSVSVLRKGRAWVETAVAVVADDTAYVQLSGAIGKFTNVSTNNMATGGKFRSTVGAAGLAEVEINIP